MGHPLNQKQSAPVIALRPKFRGVSHEVAAFVAVAAAIWLVLKAPTEQARIAAAIYGLAIVGLFAVSAVYHRVKWVRASSRAWMRRLDHSMIFVMVAGSVTPIATIVLDGPFKTVVLSVAWGMAGIGIMIKLFWINAPKWLSASIYVGMGWAGIALFPKLVGDLGIWPGVGLLGGGAFYTIGAIVYARRSPNPSPMVFGYHEIFHALVILAVIAHFAVVAFAVIPYTG